jgi:hypothetical protein
MIIGIMKGIMMIPVITGIIGGRILTAGIMKHLFVMKKANVTATILIV